MNVIRRFLEKVFCPLKVSCKVLRHRSNNISGYSLAILKIQARHLLPFKPKPLRNVSVQITKLVSELSTPDGKAFGKPPLYCARQTPLYLTQEYERKTKNIYATTKFVVARARSGRALFSFPYQKHRRFWFSIGDPQHIEITISGENFKPVTKQFKLCVTQADIQVHERTEAWPQGHTSFPPIGTPPKITFEEDKSDITGVLY